MFTCYFTFSNIKIEEIREKHWKHHTNNTVKYADLLFHSLFILSSVFIYKYTQQNILKLQFSAFLEACIILLNTDVSSHMSHILHRCYVAFAPFFFNVHMIVVWKTNHTEEVS